MKPGWALRGRPFLSIGIAEGIAMSSLCQIEPNRIDSHGSAAPRPNPAKLLPFQSDLQSGPAVPNEPSPNFEHSTSSPVFAAHHHTTCFTERTQYCWQPEQTQ